MAQLLFHLRIDRRDLFRRFCTGSYEGAFAQRLTIQISKHLAGTFERNQVVLIEVDSLRPDLGPILHGLGDVRGKVSGVGFPTLRALLELRLVFAHFDADGRNVKHLALCIPTRCDVLQRGLTTTATRDPMDPHMIGALHSFERLPWMPRLSTTRLAAGLAQTVRTGFLESVAGRGLATVAAVFRELVFQCLHPRFQRTDHREQFIKQRADRVFALLVDRTHLFTSR